LSSAIKILVLRKVFAVTQFLTLSEQIVTMTGLRNEHRKIRMTRILFVQLAKEKDS
jgi:hypothetical protein